MAISTRDRTEHGMVAKSSSRRTGNEMVTDSFDGRTERGMVVIPLVVGHNMKR
jgi:hypothetical protein